MISRQPWRSAPGGSGAWSLPRWVAGSTDVTNREAIRRLVVATLDRYGRIDGLINNAGVSLYAHLDELDLEEFTQVLALNVVSVVPSVGGYAATKSALNMLTSVSRKELGADVIAVSLVLPFITATKFGGGHYQPGQQTRPGMIAYSPEYVAQ